MKKLLLMFAVAGMVFTACEGNGLNDPNKPSNKTVKIATIEEQCANIQATITTLQNTREVVNATITSLSNGSGLTRGSDNNGVKTMIAALEERVETLEAIISNLQGYTEDELSTMTDWTEATFATLEQYNTLATELATLKTLVKEFDVISIESLTHALTISEASMKLWVNEQLSGYITIAEVGAQIAALSTSITEGNQALHKEIETLTSSLSEIKSDIEASYKEAIQTAIVDFAGIINDQISKEITSANERISKELKSIYSRLDTIEERLDKLEDIVSNLVTRIQSASYLDNGDAKVISTAEGSTITLSYQISPNSAISDLEDIWQDAISIKARYIGTTPPTFTTMPIISFIGDTANGVITVVASGENLPGEFFTGAQEIAVALQISDGNNCFITDYINIVPTVWMATEIKGTPADNEIWYITTDGNPIEMEYPLGDDMETHTFDQERGLFIIRNKEAITALPNYSWPALTAIAIPKTASSSNGYFYYCERVYISDLSAWCNMDFLRLENNPLSKYAILYLNNEIVTNITIPDDITEIKDYAFSGTALLKSVTIHDKVTSIGIRALASPYIEEITLPSGLTAISNEVFSGCSSLQSIEIPESVKTIGNKAFANCRTLKQLNIPNNVESIDYSAFYNCESLKEISLPKSVTNVGSDIFSGCSGELIIHSHIVESDDFFDVETPGGPHYWLRGSKFSKITLPKDITKIGNGTFYECSTIKEIELPKSITAIGDNAFNGCSGLNLALHEGITSIGDYALAGCSGVTIPNSVTSFGDNALYNCTGELIIDNQALGLYGGQFTKLTIGDSVTSIKNRAFSRCSSLTSVTIGNSVSSIGESAFSGCSSLTSVTIGNSVSSIGLSAFLGCSSLTSVTIGNSVTSIGMQAFSNCSSLASVTIGNSVSSIGRDAFSNCSSLTSVTIPNSVTSIESGAFRRCSNLTAFYGKFASEDNRCLIVNKKLNSFASAGLTSYTILDSVTSIGEYAFQDCTCLTSVTIPNNVTSIGSSAFSSCSSLTSVTIPNSVTSIGSSAFSNCSSLASVYCKATTPPKGGSEMFNNNSSDRKIYVPTASVEAYKSAEYWSDYADHIVGYDF